MLFDLGERGNGFERSHLYWWTQVAGTHVLWRYLRLHELVKVSQVVSVTRSQLHIVLKRDRLLYYTRIGLGDELREELGY